MRLRRWVLWSSRTRVTALDGTEGSQAMFKLTRSAPRLLVLAVLALGFAGCTQTKTFVHDRVPKSPAGGVDVLLLEPDVQLSELSAGGIAFPKADWTEQGRANVHAALVRIMGRKNARLVYYEPPGAVALDDPYTQILKLHEAVGAEILADKYSRGSLLALPTKKDKFDWTLGPDVRYLREAYAADYALFVYFRDSFASGGRVAMMAVLAMAGVALPGGLQVGYASLVDLNSGDILWFNVLSSQAGDLRDPESAVESTENLLDELPL